MLGSRLNTIHNLFYYQHLMQGLRQAIAAGHLQDFVQEFYTLREKNPPSVA
jgi:queuine tRNA-ribosyltransferase